MHQKLIEKKSIFDDNYKPILLFDSLQLYVSKITNQKLIELGYEILSIPLYSDDLQPTSHYLFKDLDEFILNRRFKNEKTVLSVFKKYVALKHIHHFLKPEHIL